MLSATQVSLYSQSLPLSLRQSLACHRLVSGGDEQVIASLKMLREKKQLRDLPIFSGLVDGLLDTSGA